mgnify:CR=1 FL=1
MKLIIQIPCLNEEASLASVLESLPTQIGGVDQIERLVIDDGSTDRTVEVARACGVEHIISLGRRRGLAAAFMAGVDRALREGADIIVNMDGDHQYDGADIPALVAPILEGRAQLVVGERPVRHIAHFSAAKKLLQHVGSAVVRLLSGVDVNDAPSGFRAITADTALQLNVFSKYTYTLEMLIQAGGMGLAIDTAPVRVNPPTRPSRLASNMAVYLIRSAMTIVRMFIVYRPFRFFFFLGCAPLLAGLALLASGGFQPAWPPALAFGAAAFAWGLAVLGDLIAINRRLLEAIRYRLRRDELRAIRRRGAQRSLEDEDA